MLSFNKCEAAGVLSFSERGSGFLGAGFSACPLLQSLTARTTNQKSKTGKKSFLRFMFHNNVATLAMSLCTVPAIVQKGV